MRTSLSAPIDSPRSLSTASQCCSSRSAVGVRIVDDVGSPTTESTPRITGSATHSPIIGMCPASKSGHAIDSRYARLAANRSGSSSVPERYGPAIRINIGRVMVHTLRAETCRNKHVRATVATISDVLASQRQTKILEMLGRDGSVVAKDLAVRWEVSEDTVRRDLRELAAEGLLQRVHGGALPVSAAAGDFEARRNVATDEKQIVARLAAGFVADGQTMFIDGGTTGQALCRALPPDLRATVITHSPTIAVELTTHVHVDVFLI